MHVVVPVDVNVTSVLSFYFIPTLSGIPGFDAVGPLRVEIDNLETQVAEERTVQA